MRFIEKKESPAFFENLKEKHRLDENKKWKKFCGIPKETLVEVLRQEQCCLCIYCECFLPDDDDSCYEELEQQLRKDSKNVKGRVGGDNRSCSHIEHLKPKERYSSLKFVYENLTLSCQGIDDKDEMRIEKTCGHAKYDCFDEEKFINPVEEHDIAKYFSYDEEEGRIIASGVNDEKSNHMIELLNLNSKNLLIKRHQSKQALEAVYRSLPSDDQLEFLQKELSSNREYMSFLRYCFLPNAVAV
jgi:uncharacterized protein (TIGR02646 family)